MNTTTSKKQYVSIFKPQGTETVHGTPLRRTLASSP